MKLGAGNIPPLHDMGTAEKIPLEQIKAQLLGGLKLFIGFDFFRQQLHVVAADNLGLPLKLGKAHLADVKLDDFGQLDERQETVFVEEIVESQDIPFPDQLLAGLDDLGCGA